MQTVRSIKVVHKLRSCGLLKRLQMPLINALVNYKLQNVRDFIKFKFAINKVNELCTELALYIGVHYCSQILLKPWDIRGT